MTRLPRASGVLLHPTSLPGPHGSGDLGPSARHFIDWLVAAGQRLWQVLPLGCIGPGNSPYMSASAFAGNPLLVDLEALRDRGWLDAHELAPHAGLRADRVDFAAVVPWRMARLAWAHARFRARGDAADLADFEAFRERESGWLDDFALFMALADARGQQAWAGWPAALARRAPVALAAATREHGARADFWRFTQWCFDTQWRALRGYAAARGVRLIGDLPIFVAWQSADVWAHQALFDLDLRGWPRVVAGVPPDFFSQTGQRWGNPLYRWDEHARQGYAWWIARLRRSLALADIVRIDHFRGFAAHWEIPAQAPTAIEGRWMPGPGAALFGAAQAALGDLPLIAEDLGIITDDVVELRRDLGFPGMRILQFAFGGDATNPYLPHCHEPDSVVYTGTHDNDTTAGWWASAPAAVRAHVAAYLGPGGRDGRDGPDMAAELVRTALASVARTAIVPMQDVLGLGPGHRMNTPGELQDCWAWRFEWSQVHDHHARRLAHWVGLYGRDGRQD
jgi:4-alpha-glucanotransferase